MPHSGPSLQSLFLGLLRTPRAASCCSVGRASLESPLRQCCWSLPPLLRPQSSAPQTGPEEAQPRGAHRAEESSLLFAPLPWCIRLLQAEVHPPHTSPQGPCPGSPPGPGVGVLVDSHSGGAKSASPLTAVPTPGTPASPQAVPPFVRCPNPALRPCRVQPPCARSLDMKVGRGGGCHRPG